MACNARFNELIESSRLFDIQHTKLLEHNNIDAKVLEIITNYFVSYISYFNLSNEQVVDKHTKFLTEYNSHLKEFKKTNQYPSQNQIIVKKERLDYDLVLLCSAFLSYHRYCIIETLYRKINVQVNQSILVVGVGPGIELALLNHKSKNIFAYDTDIGIFIKNTFPEVSFFEKYFVYEPEKLYDYILLIELLEHLEDPEYLLTEAMRSLQDNGRIHFTTAVNIPQFDHLYNFKLNDENLEKWILNNGFKIEYKWDIPHNYLVNVNAYNCYYIIKKNNEF